MKPTAAQIEAGIASAKSQIPPIYRNMVSDAEITSFVTKIATAILNAPTAPTTGA
jgi:hypothetical protein